MKGNNWAQREFQLNPELKTQGQALLDLFLQSQVIDFNKNDLNFDINLLIDIGEATETSTNKIHLVGGDIFFSLLLEELKQNFTIELDGDFSKVDHFIDSVREFYQKQGLQINYSLFSQFETWLLLTSNKDYGHNFLEYALTVKREDSKRDLFEFSHSFSKALPFMTISPEDLHAIVSHLRKEMLVDGQIDMAEGELKVAVKNLSRNNPEQGEQILNYFKEEADMDNEAMALAGQIEAKGVEYLIKIKSTYMTEQQPTFVYGLSMLRNIDNELVAEILKIQDNLDLKNPDVAKFVPHIYYSIINLSDRVSDELKEECFERLSSMWEISSEMKLNILHQINYLNGFLNGRRELIYKAVEDKSLKLDWIKDLYGLHEVTAPDFFYKLVEMLSLREGMKFDYNLIKLYVSDLVIKDDGSFSQLLIRLMIHNSGVTRYAGDAVYSHLNHEGRFKFKFDILSLSEVEQQKLIVATFAKCNSPQSTIPNLLRLLDSHHKSVVSFLIEQLNEMVQSYFNSVIEVMENSFKNGDYKNKKALNGVKSFYKRFKAQLDEKRKILELSAWQNELPLAKYHSELNLRKQNRLFRDAMDNKSDWTQFISKVSLIKGGGWKTKGRTGVQQLGKIESSYTLPRIYFIAPEEFDKSVSEFYLTTWE